MSQLPWAITGLLFAIVVMASTLALRSRNRAVKATKEALTLGKRRAQRTHPGQECSVWLNGER